MIIKDNFAYFSIKTCCWYSLESPQCGDSDEYPQHMFLIEAILMGTHNICFNGEIMETILNYPRIPSSVPLARLCSYPIIV